MTAGTTTDTPALEKALEELSRGAPGWTASSLDEKVALLEALPRKLFDVAPQMVAAALDAKGISSRSSWATDEWTTGVWVPIQAINTQLRVLERILAGKEPVDAGAVHTRPDGQVTVDIFPLTAYDRLLFHGYRATVWIEPGRSAVQTRREAAGIYRGQTPGRPEVCLVLGAGNMSAITMLDVIDQLYVRGNVCALKLNPVNDYLGPFYAEIFSDFISRGWVRILYGGADVGGYLAGHPKTDSIHITGSAATYDAVTWGTDDRAAIRKAINTPLLDKPITAELGGISPFIVVPGEWSDADLRFQAEHIATTKLANCGHNCNATQVLVIPQNWPLADKLVAEVRTIIRDAEPRPPYYPRSQEKTAQACQGMPGTEFLCSEKTRALITDVDPDSGASILTDEVFGGVLGIVRLPGDTPKKFLHNAVEFANDVLPGSLGAVIAIDPKTRKHNAKALDDAVARLRYGAIGINIWSGIVFALAPWGAYPGNTPQDIGSGIGVVHNPFMLTHLQKAVVEVPFRPAPRSFFGGEMSLSPKPVFFITNKTARTTMRRLIKFAVHPNPAALPGIFAAAVRG
ncbi:aldehyde dehydrogenase family protein [Mycobacterium montefiorense]|uniref:aldehyde dehydrogenase family protein n=1 Tax=Mycobacterium montefiorense TaxID=154654 RepID=UPI0021DD3767|nr:aldehyde dehydrogenase family protein [Mycobacterium montefiorense]MCV7425141.1 aldehyde dehydrogenase family protein [Mycobacterium montefiorense]GLE50718.1 putative aldehyde dehydrogenase [Mycobacterium montefiorense]